MSYENTAEVQEQEQEDNVVAMEPKKRERKPKLDAEGQPIVKAVRTPKEPKPPKLWPQWNEDGSPLLDSEGQQVMLETRMKKPKAPKAQRLDADGNPIKVSRVVPSDEATVLRVDAEKVEKIAKYKVARADNAKMLEDGMTLGAFIEAGGDKGFLRFYMRDGAVSI